MNSKQRVRAAVRRQQPDRTPFLAFFTSEVHDKLSALYGLGGDALSVHLGHDMLVLVAGIWRRIWTDEAAQIDTWGIRWHDVDYGPGRYQEILAHPLADAESLAGYTFPDPLADLARAPVDDVLARYGGTHWIVGGPVGTIFESAWMLRGFDRFMEDLLVNPAFAGELLDGCMEYHLAQARRFVEKGVDMIWTGDDFGQQHGMLLSPALWRRVFKPRYQHFYAELRRLNPDIVIAHHSDGNIEAIIPDFIEIGLDVLQAVQPRSMDPAKLKQLYGDRLAFWGTLDVQGTFPFGAPEDVAAEVRQRIATVGRGGGLILAPSHNIQPDVPLRNLRAYYQTARPDQRELYARMED